jgi:hypothetical protein
VNEETGSLLKEAAAKGKVFEGVLGEWRYSSTHSLTSVNFKLLSQHFLGFSHILSRTDSHLSVTIAVELRTVEHS